MTASKGRLDEACRDDDNDLLSNRRRILCWISGATFTILAVAGALLWELVVRTQSGTTMEVGMVVLDATPYAPQASVDLMLSMGSKWSSLQVKDVQCSLPTGDILMNVQQQEKEDGSSYHLDITTRQQDVAAHAALLWKLITPHGVDKENAGVFAASPRADNNYASLDDVLNSLVCHIKVGILLGHTLPFSHTVKLYAKDFMPNDDDDKPQNDPSSDSTAEQHAITWSSSVEKMTTRRLGLGMHVAMPAKTNDDNAFYPSQVRVVLPALTIQAAAVDQPAVVVQTNLVNTTLMEVLADRDQGMEASPWVLLMSVTCDAQDEKNGEETSEEKDSQAVIFPGMHRRKENRRSDMDAKCAWYTPLLEAISSSTNTAMKIHVNGGGSFLEALLGTAHVINVRLQEEVMPPKSVKELHPLRRDLRQLQTQELMDPPGSTLLPLPDGNQTDGSAQGGQDDDPLPDGNQTDESAQSGQDDDPLPDGNQTDESAQSGQDNNAENGKNHCLRIDDETGAFDVGFCYFLQFSKGFTVSGDLTFYDYFMSGKFDADWEQLEDASETTFQLEATAIANMHDDGRLNMTMQLTLDWTENTNVVILMQAVNAGSFAPFALFVESSANTAEEDLFTLQILQATLTLDNDNTPFFDPTGDLVVNSAEQSISFNMEGDNLVGSLQGALLPEEDTLMATNTFVWEGEEVWNMALLGQVAASSDDATDLVLQLNETMAIGFALVGKVEVDSITQTFKATLEEVENSLMQLSLGGAVPEDEGTLTASTLLVWDGIDVWNITMEGGLEEGQDLFTNDITFTMSLQEEVTNMLSSGSVKVLNSDVLSIVIQRFAFQYDLEALVEMTGVLTVDSDNSAFAMVLEDNASLNFAANVSLTWFSDDENAERGATLQQAVISRGGDVVLFLIDSTFTDRQGAGSVILVSDPSAKLNLGLSINYRWWDFLDLLTVQFQQILVGWEDETRADLTGQARLDIGGQSLVTITMEDFTYLDMEANITVGWLTNGAEKGVHLHKALLDVALEPIMDLEGLFLFDTKTCSEEDDGRCSLNLQVEDFGNLDFVTRMIGNWGTESISGTIFFNLNELSLVAASETFIDLVMGFRLQEQEDLIIGKMDCLSDPAAELDMNMAMNFTLDSNDGSFAILMDHLVLGWGDTTLMEMRARPARFSLTQETEGNGTGSSFEKSDLPSMVPNELVSDPPSDVPSVVPSSAPMTLESTVVPSVPTPTQSPVKESPVLPTEPVSQRFDNMSMVIPGMAAVMSNEARDAWIATTESFYNDLYNSPSSSARQLQALHKGSDISSFFTTIEFQRQFLDATGLNVLYAQVIAYNILANSTTTPFELIASPLEVNSTNVVYTAALRTSNPVFKDVQDNAIKAPTDTSIQSSNVSKNTNANNEDDGLGVGAIVGIAVGGFACCAAVIFLVICRARSGADEDFEDENDCDDDYDEEEEGNEFIKNGDLEEQAINHRDGNENVDDGPSMGDFSDE